MICVIVKVKKPLVTGRMEISQSKSLISRLYCGKKSMYFSVYMYRTLG